MNKFFIFFVFLFTSSMFAEDFAVFTGLGGDKKWDNPANWSTNRVPSENDEALIPKDFGVQLYSSARVKKLTIEGTLASYWKNGGSIIYVDQLNINKSGEILMLNNLQILPKTNQLNVVNEGLIYTDNYYFNPRLVIGDHSPGNDIRMSITGGQINFTDFQFNGFSLDLNDAKILGFVNIQADFMSMTGKSKIAALEDCIEEFPIKIDFSKSFYLTDKCEIYGNGEKSEKGGSILIRGNHFANYGTIKPGFGKKKAGHVAIHAQHLINNGSIGSGSSSVSSKDLGNKSILEDNTFSNVIFSGDSVVIAMQDTSMIQADILKVYGKNIVVAIQREAGIALFNGIEFYNTEDGTIDFTQTTVINAIAGGYSKKIHSNHILPTNQSQIQMIFFGNVNFYPADTTKIDASVTLTKGYSFAKTDGTLRLNLQNLSTAEQSIHYEVNSILGWVSSVSNSTGKLAPFAIDSAEIPYHIPDGTVRGTEDTVQVRILINNVAIDTIYSTITCLSKSTKPLELASINITPIEVELSIGEQQQFKGVCLTADEDTLYYYKPLWFATGGTVDTTGLYKATEVGNFLVICADTASGIADSALVHVIATGIEPEDEAFMTKFSMLQNYPNPFNQTTTIRFSLPKAEFVTLKVYDVLGNEIKTLLNLVLNSGEHSVVFDAKDLRSGVYYYQLNTNSFSTSKLMEIIK